MMGAFTSTYNYLRLRLHLPPFSLRQSAIGTLSGLAWEHDAWAGVTAALALCVILALVAAWRLRHLPAFVSPPALTPAT